MSTALLVEADEDELATFQKKNGPLHESRQLLQGLIGRLEQQLAHPQAQAHAQSHSAKPAAASQAAAGHGGGEKAEKQAEKPAAAGGKKKADKDKKAADAAPASADVSGAQLAVGRLSGVKRHTDRLLTAQVDLGGKQPPRPLVTGLAEHYAPEQLEGRLVVTVLNLKPARMQGAESAAMLLAADAPGHAPPVILVAPPAGAQPGDTVAAADAAPPAQFAVLDRAGWGAIASQLRVQAGVATAAGRPLQVTGHGSCACPAPDGAPIH